MGSFLDSYFSFDVVTESPGDSGRSLTAILHCRNVSWKWQLRGRDFLLQTVVGR
jgi:hypothetical protein